MTALLSSLALPLQSQDFSFEEFSNRASTQDNMCNLKSTVTPVVSSCEAPCI